MFMVFYSQQEIVIRKHFNNFLSCFISVKSPIFRRNFITFFQLTFFVNNPNWLEVMAFADFIIVRVVSRCNLNRTCTERFINIFISNNRNSSVCQRYENFFADKFRILLITRVNSNRNITKHCFRSCCINNNRTRFVN